VTVQGHRNIRTVWTFATLASLAWALMAVIFAWLAPPGDAPRIFNDRHIEHFAAFYVVALLSAAALPMVRLVRIGMWLSAMAGVLALIRSVAWAHGFGYWDDWSCDVGGVLAALVPIVIGRFRAGSDREPD
jgi:hypothetical protein